MSTLHTPRDAAALHAAGINPDSTQPRERLVPCEVCQRPTAHQARRCDTHYIAPHAARHAAPTQGAAA